MNHAGCSVPASTGGEPKMSVPARANRGYLALWILATLPLLLAPTALACLNDGTANPCQCAMKMMVSAANGQVYTPVASPTLTNAAPLSAPPLVLSANFSATIGDDFYDYNGDGVG